MLLSDLLEVLSSETFFELFVYDDTLGDFRHIFLSEIEPSDFKVSFIGSSYDNSFYLNIEIYHV